MSDDDIFGTSAISYIDADILAEILKYNQNDDANDMLIVDVRDDDFGPHCIKDAINVPSQTFEMEETKSNLLKRIKVIIIINNLIKRIS